MARQVEIAVIGQVHDGCFVRCGGVFNYQLIFVRQDVKNLARQRAGIIFFSVRTRIGKPKHIVFSVDYLPELFIESLQSPVQVIGPVVYGQLILENASKYTIDVNTVEQIFDFMVRDFSRHALNLFCKPSTTNEQMEFCKRMIVKPEPDDDRFLSVWENQVMAIKDGYVLQQ